MTLYTIAYEAQTGKAIAVKKNGQTIPLDPNNSNYQEFLAWNAQQSVPLKLDPIAPVASVGEVNATDANSRWNAISQFKGKTPTEIYTYLQGQIDGWNGVADIKAGLRVWLPLIISILAWRLLRDLNDS